MKQSGSQPIMAKSKIDLVPKLWAVMPVKNFDKAKERLSPFLTRDERKALFGAMVEDILETLAHSRGLAGILVVTCDPDAIKLAKRYGCETLIEEANAGHSAASSFGAEALAANHIAGMIQIPGDLPALTAADIEAALSAHGDAPSITIAPSRDEFGSNAVVCSPPNLLPFHFGDDSFSLHLDKARRLGVEPVILRRPGFALDIDTADDLRAFLDAPRQGRTLAYLNKSGIVKRLMTEAEG